jgi:hypothetical protein
MTSPRTDLSAFATGLADRLPGIWTSDYQSHAQYADQFPRTEQLWDAGHVDYVVSQYVLTDLGWCAGWSADLHLDRSITTWRCSTPPGFHAGDFWRHWESPDATIPIGPTTLLARTELVRASGGYAALPQGEDYAYLVGVKNGAARGALLPTVVYHYRKHAEQMTAQPEYPAMELQARRFAWNHGKHLESLRKDACTCASVA